MLVWLVMKICGTLLEVTKNRIGNMPFNLSRILCSTCYCLLFLANPYVVLAGVYVDPGEQQAVVGRLQHTLLSGRESLVSLAARKRLGQNAIVLANPELDRWLPATDTIVKLPTFHLLPDVERRGVVINLPEYRLYVYDTLGTIGTRVIRTYPISIGRYDWKTPVGQTTITEKIINPTWTPPDSIRREAAETGRTLPAVVAAGPDNPLGQHALRLGWPGYLIHGTNKPMAIGMDVTHGCVRMYPVHIKTLYKILPVGTRVTIINEPVKIGWNGNQLFLEVHPPQDAVSDQELVQNVINLLRTDARVASLTVRTEMIRQIVRAKSGIPTLLAVASGSHTLVD